MLVGKHIYLIITRPNICRSYLTIQAKSSH